MRNINFIKFLPLTLASFLFLAGCCEISNIGCDDEKIATCGDRSSNLLPEGNFEFTSSEFLNLFGFEGHMGYQSCDDSRFQTPDETYKWWYAENGQAELKIPNEGGCASIVSLRFLPLDPRPGYIQVYARCSGAGHIRARIGLDFYKKPGERTHCVANNWSLLTPNQVQLKLELPRDARVGFNTMHNCSCGSGSCLVWIQFEGEGGSSASLDDLEVFQCQEECEESPDSSTC